MWLNVRKFSKKYSMIIGEHFKPTSAVGAHGVELHSWIDAILENRIREFSPVGDIQMVSMSKGCHIEIFTI